MTAAQPTTIQSRYDAYGCYLGSSYANKIVDWMTARGRTGYRDAIQAAQATYSETIGDAGRHWQHCQFTQEQLEVINAEIDDHFRDACDRYEDWASD